ncbi:hypothetical protein FH039_05555 [Thermococcus indicus]|uniref:Uncharacterized protein n=1 Tax=Thermococcus indicus TaxID=2586643 RepID=A0A4Y5SLV4_9EURY|nr:hypothetical protein [Thermococcus indicus]QDA31169.1 hypothetical protein FH039_05555 [Thermococcus indicus]
MPFSIFFFGWEEALRGEVPADTLTIAIKHGDETIPLGDCFTKDAVRDVIDAIAFATNSCEGVKELHLRSGRCDVLLFPGRYCADNNIVLRFGTYEPISHVYFKIRGDLLRLEIYREDRKDVEAIEVLRVDFIRSALDFVRSFLAKFPDEELMRELEIVEEMAGRKGLLPAEEKFEIKVEWLGEVKCRKEEFPIVYAVVSYGREIFSGLVEPVAFAGDLINLLKFAKGMEVGCEINMTPYNDIVERAMLLFGDKKVSDYLLLWFGSEWPGTVFVFKNDSELVFVNAKTGFVIEVKKEEAETLVANAVVEIIRELQEWDGELFGPIRKEDAVSMLTGELKEAFQ